jgi:hypothetical protein
MPFLEKFAFSFLGVGAFSKKEKYILYILLILGAVVYVSYFTVTMHILYIHAVRLYINISIIEIILSLEFNFSLCIPDTI